ncbi:MAG: fimbrillin family protein [Odoribacteraceae bacterium]|nr:fimbrillin family protein [Odoribacteraceae bacterium]
MRNIIMIAVFLASCGRDDATDSKLILLSRTAAPTTRSTVDNTWNGGEQVYVSIDNGAANTFIAAAEGTLTPLDEIYWQSSGQTISARAWYPDPDTWSFSIDQSNGLQGADFVFAPTVSGIRYNNHLDNPLLFHHLTAKVTVHLTAGTDIDDVSRATLSLYGAVAGTVNTNDGLIAGTGEGWITPYRAAGTDTYTALLIPRDMTGVQFLKITLDGYDYYYTPSVGAADLEPGNSYAYDITVHKTRLTVTVAGTGVTWNDSGNGGTVTGIPVE